MRELTVFGQRRDVPSDFPGEVGTIAILKIAPPIDVACFRCLPQMSSLHSNRLNPDFIREQLELKSFAVPRADEIPHDLEGVRSVGSAMVYRPEEYSETHLFRLVEDNRVSLSIYFVGSVLRFRVRHLEVQFDCGWASAVEGVALFRWEPGRVSITYQAHDPDGVWQTKVVSSDRYHLDAVLELARAGDNVGTLEQSVRDGVPSTPFAIAVCAISASPLSNSSKTNISRIYAEAAQSLVALPEFAGAPAALPVYLRSDVVSPSQFASWRQRSGRPSGTTVNVSSVLIASNIPSEVVAEIQDLHSYAVRLSMARVGEDATHVPLPPRLIGRDAWSLVCHQLHHRRILDDARSWQLRDAIEARAWANGRKVVLRCGHLAALYALLGTEWLEKKADEVRKRFAAKRVTTEMVADVHPGVTGWMWLRDDVILTLEAHEDAKIRAWAWLTQVNEDWARVASRMALDVRDDLLHRLRGKAHLEAAFELRIAAAWSEAKWQVDFIPAPKSRAERAPDLRANFEGMDVFVECSHKQAFSREIERARNLAADLATLLLREASKREESVSIKLTFKGTISPEAVHDAKVLVRRIGRQGREETDSAMVEVNELGTWQEVHETNSLCSRISDEYDRIFVGGARRDYWPATRLTHAGLVAIAMNGERDMLKSVNKTLREKARWKSRGGQVPDESVGVLALHLGDARRATVSRLVPDLRSLIERQYGAVSMLLLVWDEREHDAMSTTEVRTFALPVVNNRAERSWPTGLSSPIGEMSVFRVQS